ncbi:hypothetical protein NQ314_011079 [Rhamnusium bicolor]|uniref:Phospholipase B1, membrane-associated n=1 Tax=Rhamnusium bicolor TaxID=1586634 RepID=A0AAV8XMH1_9CUCU|nr:hypothetical protein NQ314_011079 [Rhamnusium bicolor]
MLGSERLKGKGHLDQTVEETLRFEGGFVVVWRGICIGYRTNLVVIENSLVMAERYIHNGRIGNFIIRYPKITNSNIRSQLIFPKSMPFPCHNNTSFGTGRSVERPTSVHRLRPGDIDVIGALGDSLIAGNGAMEEWALGTMIEYRGVSWCAAADADALRQAKILVNKMKKNKNININKDWKMITLFFGANDICSAQCYDKEKASARSHIRKLMRALDYLEKNLPRTFVNLIPVLDVSVSIRIKRTMMCRLLHGLFCGCFHRGGNEMEIITRLTKEYQKAEEELVMSGRYDKKEDFTVVLQPFMKLFNAPIDPAHRYNEVIDISYITHDCFHFSQKGHALGANLLWNNLLQPVGRKSKRKLNYIMENFECPKLNSPYLFTNKNSKTFLATGRQWSWQANL